MPNIVIVVTFLYILAGVIQIIVGVKTYEWRFRLHSNAFSGLLFCFGIYCIGYGLELNSHGFIGKTIALYIQYFGIVFIPAYWLVLAIDSTDRIKWSSNKSKALIFLLPIITWLVVITNYYHSLYYTQIIQYQNGPFAILHFERGPWFWVFLIYTNIYMILGYILFLSSWHTSTNLYRRQTRVLLIASVFPWITFFLFLNGYTPYGLDLVPVSHIISVSIFWYGFKDRDFNNLIPIARNVVFDVISDGIIVIDEKNQLADFNNAAKNFFTNLSYEHIGIQIKEVFKDFPDVLEILKKKNTSVSRIKIMADNRVQYIDFGISALHDNKGHIILLHDVTDQMKLLNSLNELAIKDDLTGVYKRTHFFDLCHKKMTELNDTNTPVSLIILDIDLFKKINDTYGHQFGDEVLHTIAESLKAVIRDQYILGRFGGEEFVIFLPNTKVEKAYELAEELRRIIKNSYVSAGDDLIINITASFGVAGMDYTEITSFNRLFANADIALYTAKNGGRNRVAIYNDEQNAAFKGQEVSIKPPDRT